MGAPPSKKARAGRMNPAGISYLYLAFEQETALAEVIGSPPCTAIIAQFQTLHELRILDLTKLPVVSSIFDYAHY
jgi:RES domain-containing protein